MPHGGKLNFADDALTFAIALSTPDWKGMAQRSRSHSCSLQHTMALLPADAHSMYDILVLDDINTAYEQQALDLSQTWPAFARVLQNLGCSVGCCCLWLVGLPALRVPALCAWRAAISAKYSASVCSLVRQQGSIQRFKLGAGAEVPGSIALLQGT
jgi:hypothetical protein